MHLSRLPFLQKHLFILVHLKRLVGGGFGKKYFSQWGEDVILQRLFADKPKGFYVDVGAYHPLHYSNTYLLHWRGWRGMNIDPNPLSITLFQMYRPKDHNVNSGIAREVTTRPYYMFNHQSCNTFSEEQKEKMLQKSYTSLIDTKNMPCVPLQQIIDEYVPGVMIDFLNIDVEGNNLEVLHTLDLQKNAPKVICIEDDEFSFAPSSKSASAIFMRLSQNGYALHSKVGLSCIYVKQ